MTMDGRMVGVDLLGNLPEWQERALCAQADPEAWFPEKGGSTREAKRICGRCEVKAECLEYALGHDERFGIWGGLSERERRRLNRRVEVTPAPTTQRMRRMAAAGVTKKEIGRQLEMDPRAVSARLRRAADRDAKAKPEPVGGGVR